jgi:hypothetical protein
VGVLGELERVIGARHGRLQVAQDGVDGPAFFHLDLRLRCQRSTDLSDLQRPTQARRVPCSECQGEGKWAFENTILRRRDWPDRLGRIAPIARIARSASARLAPSLKQCPRRDARIRHDSNQGSGCMKRMLMTLVGVLFSVSMMACGGGSEDFYEGTFEYNGVKFVCTDRAAGDLCATGDCSRCRRV